MASMLSEGTLSVLLLWVGGLWLTVVVLGEIVRAGLEWSLRKLGLQGDGSVPHPQVATVRKAFSAEHGVHYATGLVTMRGELWAARCGNDLAPTLHVGDRVRVDRLDGLVAEIGGRLAAVDRPIGGRS